MADSPNATSWIVALASTIGAMFVLGSRVSKHLLIALIVSAYFLISLSGIAILGYALQLPILYTFPPEKGNEMALLTAICILVIGLGKITIAATLRRIIREFGQRIKLIEADLDAQFFGSGREVRDIRLEKQVIKNKAGDLMKLAE